MPDNITLSSGTGAGSIIHTDLVVKGTVSGHYQRIKIVFGASGAGTDVHATQRFPVSATGTVQPVRVSGSVTIVEPITISGTVKVSGGPVQVKATGTALAVKVSGSVTIVEPITISGTVISRVSGSVTLVEPITISGNVGVSGTRADRGAFTKATSKVFPIGGYFGTGGLSASGQVGVIRTSSQGITFIRATGTSLPIKVSGSVTLVEPITISGTVKVSGGPVSVKATGTALAVKVSGNVNLSEPITISGTVMVKATGVGLEVQGTVAHGAAASGNPVLMGGVARLSQVASPVTTGDTSQVMTDFFGKQIIVANAPARNASTGATVAHGPLCVLVKATGPTVLMSGRAGGSFYITSITMSNASGDLVASVITTANTLATGAGKFSMFLISGGGGVVQKFDPPWKIPQAGSFRSMLSTSGAVYYNIHYYLASGA